MTLGEVCKHGSLKRLCVNCEAEDALHASDVLALVAAEFHKRYEHWSGTSYKPLVEALAAYEKVRAGK